MTTPPKQPEPHLLGYRPRAANPAPKIGPKEWLRASLALGALSWASVVVVCAGIPTPLVPWLPPSVAAAGLVTGILAATQPLPRDATPVVFGAMFMSFSLLALWLLALVLL